MNAFQQGGARHPPFDASSIKFHDIDWPNQKRFTQKKRTFASPLYSELKLEPDRYYQYR